MNIRFLVLSATALLVCGATEPVFVTSDTNGGWSRGGYYVHNNMWNSAKYRPCTARLVPQPKEGGLQSASPCLQSLRPIILADGEAE